MKILRGSENIECSIVSRGSSLTLKGPFNLQLGAFAVVLWSNGPLPAAIGHISTSPNWKQALEPVSRAMNLTSLMILSEFHGDHPRNSSG